MKRRWVVLLGVGAVASLLLMLVPAQAYSSIETGPGYCGIPIVQAIRGTDGLAEGADPDATLGFFGPTVGTVRARCESRSRLRAGVGLVLAVGVTCVGIALVRRGRRPGRPDPSEPQSAEAAQIR